MKRNKFLVSVMLCFMLVASIFAIDKKEAHAAGNYWLQVNKGTNVVTVFRNDGTPERAFVCSVGSATPIGTFYTPNKYRWHELDGPSYGQYCTRITAGYLFHSVWYYRNGDYASQSYVQYNKLGTTASHGCVRLTVADAKWIYDNCPLGTRVTVMYGSSANDPLGKPVAIKVPNVREGWDPTDPNPANPYRASMPSISTSGANTTVPFGSAFNPLAGITAKDSLGNDVTGKVTYAGSVNTNSLGNYKITYRVTDALGRTAYADVVYTVADTQQATITGVKSSLKKEYNSTLNLKKNVKAKNVTGTDLTSQIRTKVVYPKSKEEKDYTKSTLKLNKLGTYTINYYVTNPNNGMETKVTCKVKVSDTKKPKLTGIKTKRTYEYNVTKNLKSGVKAKLVSGKNMTSKIVIKLRAPGQKTYKTLKESKYKKYQFSKVGTYKIEYSVANPYNKKAVAKKVQTVTVKDTKKPVVTWPTVPTELEYGTKQNLKAGMVAKLKSGKSVFSKVVITVTTPQKVSTTLTGKTYTFDQVGKYTIAYSVANPNNEKAVATKKVTVTVKDTKAPAITGVTNQENVTIDTKKNLKSGVTAKLVSGTDVTANIKVNVTTPGKVTTPLAGTDYTFDTVGTYTVAYTVANPSNPQAVATVTKSIAVTDNRVPEITVDANKLKGADHLKDVAAGTPYNVFEGVTAKVGQTAIPAANITAQVKDAAGTIVADLNSNSQSFTFGAEGTYTIIYTVKNPNNAEKVAVKEFTITVTPKTPSGDVTGGDGIQAQSEAGYMNPQDGAGQVQPKDGTNPPEVTNIPAEQEQPEVKDNPEEQENPEEGTLPVTQENPEEGTAPSIQENPNNGIDPGEAGNPEGQVQPEVEDNLEDGMDPDVIDGTEGQVQPEVPETLEEGLHPAE